MYFNVCVATFRDTNAYNTMNKLTRSQVYYSYLIVLHMCTCVCINHAVKAVSFVHIHVDPLVIYMYACACNTIDIL